MTKLKKLWKALLCFLEPKPQEITIEQFMEMESKKSRKNVDHNFYFNGGDL